VEQSHRLSIQLRLTVLVFRTEQLCDETSTEVTNSHVCEINI